MNKKIEGNKVKCPVCEGYETTSSNENPSNHIKRLAAYELLKGFLTDVNNPKPHAEYLKKHCKVIQKEEIIFKI